jgi:hypothetical protein
MSKTQKPTESRYVLTLRRPGRPVQRLELPTLAEALEAAKTDAAWLQGLGIVRLSMISLNASEAKG